MPAIRTNRNYSRLPDSQLSSFLGGTIDGFTDNTDLPTPVVSLTALGTLRTKFNNAIIAAAQGGAAATAVKNDVRGEVIAALDKNASYVDINCDDDLGILLGSGYQAVSTNRAQSVLQAPEVISAMQMQTGQIKLRVKGDRNRKAIQGRIKAVGGAFGPVITFRSSKEILFQGLTAGTTYVMQVMGLGGSTGQSDWSNPVERMAL